NNINLRRAPSPVHSTSPTNDASTATEFKDFTQDKQSVTIPKPLSNINTSKGPIEIPPRRKFLIGRKPDVPLNKTNELEISGNRYQEYPDNASPTHPIRKSKLPGNNVFHPRYHNLQNSSDETPKNSIVDSSSYVVKEHSKEEAKSPIKLRGQNRSVDANSAGITNKISNSNSERLSMVQSRVSMFESIAQRNSPSPNYSYEEKSTNLPKNLPPYRARVKNSVIMVAQISCEIFV
ncbi:MAG: hypothetical protein MHMPM18_004866, partial [Marteilia pararefringens]